MSICTQNSNINEKRAQYPSYDQWKHMEMSQEKWCVCVCVCVRAYGGICMERGIVCFPTLSCLSGISSDLPSYVFWRSCHSFLHMSLGNFPIKPSLFSLFLFNNNSCSHYFINFHFLSKLYSSYSCVCMALLLFC